MAKSEKKSITLYSGDFANIIKDCNDEQIKNILIGHRYGLNNDETFQSNVRNLANGFYADLYTNKQKEMLRSFLT